MDTLKLTEHVTSMLIDARYITAGDLAVQFRMNPDVLLALQGMSPKGIAEIEAALSTQRLMGIVPPKTVEVEPVETKAVEAPVEEKSVELETDLEKVTETTIEPIIEVEDDLPADLNQIFALKPEVFEVNPAAVDEEEESPDAKKSGGKKKKKKSVEVEYDPDRDVILAHKKHKRGTDDGWGNW